MRTINILLMLVFVAIISLSLAAEKMDGMIFVGFGTGVYKTPQSDESMREIVKTKANIVSIVVSWYQENINSTTISYWNGTSVDEADLAHAINTAKSSGFKVALKPHVDLRNDPSHWRGEIGTYFSNSQWSTWFKSYRVYMKYMANLCKKFHVDLFIIGTELSATETQQGQWRATIKSIREIYDGKIVYGTNHGNELGVMWWEDLDFIGIDAYYPLVNVQSPTLSQLIAAWHQYVIELEKLSKQYNKQILFTEIGYQSTTDTAMHPWYSNGALDLTAQSNCYEAVFRTIYQKDWFAGVFWWAWTSNPKDGGDKDRGFSPHNKPAEFVLEEHYKKH